MPTQPDTVARCRTGTWSGTAALRVAYSPFWKAPNKNHSTATATTVPALASSPTQTEASRTMTSVHRCRRPLNRPSRRPCAVRSDSAPTIGVARAEEMALNRGHHAEGDDLVARGDVLQLECEHDLRWRLVRHPHAQAGQGEGDDPADPDVLSRFGQRERLHARLTDHLICHGWIMTHTGRLAIVAPRSLASARVVSGMEAWEVRRRSRSGCSTGRRPRRTRRTCRPCTPRSTASNPTTASPAGSGSCAASRALSWPRRATAATWSGTPSGCRCGRRPPGGGS